MWPLGALLLIGIGLILSAYRIEKSQWYRNGVRNGFGFPWVTGWNPLTSKENEEDMMFFLPYAIGLVGALLCTLAVAWMFGFGAE